MEVEISLVDYYAKSCIELVDRRNKKHDTRKVAKGQLEIEDNISTKGESILYGKKTFQ